LNSLRKACDDKSFISVKACTRSIYDMKERACYEIMNVECKTLVERHLGKASVRLVGIKPYGI